MAKASTIEERLEQPIEVTCSIRDTGVWSKTLTVEIPNETVVRTFDQIINEIAGSLTLPGFRPGKVPRNVVERRFGERIVQQASAELLERGTRSALQQTKLDVLGNPVLPDKDCKAVKGEPFAFDLEVEVRPEFALGEYKGLEVEQEEIDLLPNELEQAVDEIRSRYATLVDAPADHEAAENDKIVGILRYLVDGSEVLKEEPAELTIISGHTYGAFVHLDASFLQGVKAGEHRSVKAELGKNYPKEELQGKQATLEFEVLRIRQKQLPAFDDEFASKLKFENAAKLKDAVREQLLAQLKRQTEQRTRDTLVQRIVEAAQFELPPRLQAHAFETFKKQQDAYLLRMGVGPEFLAGNDFDENAKMGADASLRRSLILAAVADAEKLHVTDEDMDAEIVRRARAQKMRASQYYDQLQEQQGALENIQQELVTQKVLDFLVENANIKVVPRKLPEPAAPCDHPEHAHEPGSSAPQSGAAGSTGPEEPSSPAASGAPASSPGQ